ncbi:MAG: hypothetical protein KDB14_24530 [Planctomycetales bacterium]|nr:hypothetical protein [Planctomycetales bacterium]
MDRFTTADLRNLVRAAGGTCVTLCMPTHPASEQGQQDAVRLKNLVNMAEQRLVEQGMRTSDARDMLSPLRDVVEDDKFWKGRSRGLALFLGNGELRTFRVPLPLAEMAVVSQRFHIRPLLPLLAGRQRLLVLALSQHRVRLIEVTEHESRAVEVDGLPQRMEEALNLDGADRGSQSHFSGPGGHGKQTSVFHGQGGVPDDHKDDLKSFFRLVDASLANVLRDEDAPLVLAGVEYLLPLYRQECRYPHLAEVTLTGNFDRLGEQQIGAKAWPLATELLRAERERALRKYHQLMGTGKATDDIRQTLPAAFAGQVETLFLSPQRISWGRCDTEGHVLETHVTQQPQDDDLADTAAAQTFLHRGGIYVLDESEMPTSGSLAAVMRF